MIQDIKGQYYSIENNANISIMTIHKSKGLEFDYVFLPQLGVGKNNITQSAFNYDEFQINEIKHLLVSPYTVSDKNNIFSKIIADIKNTREAFELQRLLYVGCTRAIKGLYLTAKKPSSNFKPGSLANMIPMNAAYVDSTHKAESIDNMNNPYPTLYPLNTDYITHHIIEGTETINAKCASDSLITSSVSNASTIGSLFHKILEVCNQQNKFTEPLFKRLFFSYSLPPSLYNSVLRTARLIWHNTLSYHPYMINSTQKEVTLYDQYGNKYIIDCIVENDNKLTIVDYKFPQSDKLQKDDASGMQVELYKKQLLSYVSLMRKTTNKPIKALLYYPISNEIVYINDE